MPWICVGSPTELSAEVRRRWYSPYGAIEGALAGGRPWLPARISLDHDSIRILTSERSEEFRLHRISWKGPSIFLVSGLTEKSHLRTRILRFKSPEEAQQAASSLKEHAALAQGEGAPGIIETAVPSVEEMPIGIVLLHRKSQLFFVMWRLLIFLFFLFVFATALRAGTDSLVATIFGILMVYTLLVAMSEIKMVKVKTAGWLRLEGTSLSLRTREEWIYLSPKKVNWARTDRLVVHAMGIRIELGFSSPDQASAAMQMIRAGSPRIRELH